MSDKSIKTIYLAATGVLTVIVLMYVGNSIFNNEMFSRRFESLGYPAHIIYPLTIAKIAGLIAIWFISAKALKEWAYAGFFFDFILAMLAEMHAVDGEYISSSIALISLMISYIFWKKRIRNELQKIEIKA
jgi:hypothetical protein